MRFVLLAAMLALLIGPAHAQGFGNVLDKPPSKDATETDAQKKNDEKAYRAAIERLPTASTAPVDPWGNVRSSEKPAVKATARTATKKPAQ